MAIATSPADAAILEIQKSVNAELDELKGLQISDVERASRLTAIEIRAKLAYQALQIQRDNEKEGRALEKSEQSEELDKRCRGFIAAIQSESLHAADKETEKYLTELKKALATGDSRTKDLIRAYIANHGEDFGKFQNSDGSLIEGTEERKAFLKFVGLVAGATYVAPVSQSVMAQVLDVAGTAGQLTHNPMLSGVVAHYRLVQQIANIANFNLDKGIEQGLQTTIEALHPFMETLGKFAGAGVKQALAVAQQVPVLADAANHFPLGRTSKTKAASKLVAGDDLAIVPNPRGDRTR